MPHFDPDFLQFFKDLAANNNREWFTANKKRYDTIVKKPFEIFITDLIDKVKKDDPTVQIEAKDAIFRIYRDIRFSKDKTPYKIQVSAIVSPGGRKDMLTPGMYLELGPEHVRVYGGVYMPEKNDLFNIRSYIVAHNDEFNTLIKDKKFIEMYGEVRGEKNKIIPKEFKDAAVAQPLLYNKQLYYFGQMEPEVVLSKGLINRIYAYYEAAKPMKKFLMKAIKG
ncbi:MAG TPA: TIGR02453 family protein [Flavobacteriales bacterium]|nr:TIGR02453 family protein [Flavobacteriales bacterium]